MQRKKRQSRLQQSRNREPVVFIDNQLKSPCLTFTVKQGLSYSLSIKDDLNISSSNRMLIYNQGIHPAGIVFFADTPVLDISPFQLVGT